MWLFLGVPRDPENDIVIEKDGAKALDSAVNSSMQAIWTDENDTQQNAAHWMIQIAKPWTIRKLSESKLGYGKPLVRIQKENAHLVDLERAYEDQAKSMTLAERYTSWVVSGVWRVHR